MAKKSKVVDSPQPMSFEPSISVESQKSETVDNLKIGQSVPVHAMGTVESLSSDDYSGKTTYRARLRLKGLKMGANASVGMADKKAAASIAKLKGNGGKKIGKMAKLKKAGGY